FDLFSRLRPLLPSSTSPLLPVLSSSPEARYTNVGFALESTSAIDSVLTNIEFNRSWVTKRLIRPAGGGADAVTPSGNFQRKSRLEPFDSAGDGCYSRRSLMVP